jgi:hypothetical protein
MISSVLMPATSCPVAVPRSLRTSRGRSLPAAYRLGRPRTPLSYLVRNMSLGKAAGTRPEVHRIGALGQGAHNPPQPAASEAVGRKVRRQ